MESEGMTWRDPSLRSFDLEYHNADPEESLFQALVEIDEIDPDPSEEAQLNLLASPPSSTRALARGLAVSKFASELQTACWHSLTFRTGQGHTEVALRPDVTYPTQLGEAPDVGTFISKLREVNEWTETA